MSNQLKAFEGIVLGENYHNYRSVACDSPRCTLACTDMPVAFYSHPDHTSAPDASLNVQYTQYRHEKVMVGTTEFGLWVPCNWSTEDAIDHLIRYYKPRKPKIKTKR